MSVRNEREAEKAQRPACTWTRCKGSPNPCLAWCKCACHTSPRDDKPTQGDTLRDLLGRAGDEVLIEVVAEAVRDAQVEGRVEYKRRVGLAGRRTIAETVLWRLREHLSESPTPPGVAS